MSHGALKFGPYLVLKNEDGFPWTLKEGNLKTTYLAEDTIMGGRVVIDLIRPLYFNSEQEEKSFQEDWRKVYSLRHPNIASVFELIKSDRGWVYVTEHLEGHSLLEQIKRDGPLDHGVALDYARQMTLALGLAHERGVVHRGLTPSRIYLVEEDYSKIVKITRFAFTPVIPKDPLDPSKGDALSLESHSHPFMAPEQLDGDEVTYAADWFSLGCILWTMLLGKPPFVDPHRSHQTPFGGGLGSFGTFGDVHATRFSGLSDQPASNDHRQIPWEKAKHLPAPIGKILKKLLAPQVEDRLKDASSVLKALTGLLWDNVTGELAKAPRFGEVTSQSGSEGDSSAVDLIYQVDPNVPCVDEGPCKLYQGLMGADGQRIWIRDFEPEFFLIPGLASNVEQQAKALLNLKHPNLLTVLQVTRTRSQMKVITEGAEGVSLLNVLRWHRSLRFNAIQGILSQLADAMDTLSGKGIEACDSDPSKILILPKGGDESREDWDAKFQLPASHWPEFTLKVNPLKIPWNLAGQGMEVDATLAGGAFGTVALGMSEQMDSDLVWEFARLIYLLLGGSKEGFSSAKYRAVPAMGERGNLILERHVIPARGMDDCQTLLDALIQAEKG